MKRISFIIITAILAIAFVCGCAGAPAQSGEATPAQSGEAAPEISEEAPPAAGQKNYRFDYRIRAFATFGQNVIMETDDAVYFILHGSVYFSDKEYKEFMPLCPRPDCDHKSVDCSAYADAVNMTVYGNSIYFVNGFYDNNYFLNGQYKQDAYYSSDEKPAGLHEPEDFSYPSLCRMNLDGTAHEELVKLPVPETDFTPTGNGWYTVFTDKYLIVMCRQRGDGGRTSADMYVLDMDTYETLPITCDWSDAGIHQMIAPTAGRGDTLYCVGGDSSETNADGWPIRNLCVLDCASGVLHKICVLPDDVFSSEFCWYLADDAIYYTCWQSGANRRIYRCGLEDGASVEVASGAYSEVEWEQFDWQNGMFFKDYRSDNENMQKGIYYTDLDFNRVDFSPYSEEELEAVTKPKGIMYFFQTESYIFGIGPNKNNGYSADNGVPEWYIDKSEIGTGKMMWKRWGE